MMIPKRLGIFVAYDPEGIIDDYIPYLLEDMCQNLAHLVIICNGFVNEEGLEKLRRFTDDVFVRENKGYDAGAIKDVLYNLYSWEKVYEFDELLLFNDTFYGPLYPLRQIFHEMDSRAVDFWGITEHAEIGKESSSLDILRIPRHLQSYFINVKRRLLLSEAFRAFWTSLTPDHFTHQDAVDQYEVEFTNYFAQKGFTFSSYVDTSPLFSTNPDTNYNTLHVTPYELIAQYRCPVIKRKSIGSNLDQFLVIYGNENHNRIMPYIDEKTDYNVNLIWDNLLRRCDISDIKDSLHLSYVFPVEASNPSKRSFAEKRVAVIIHAYYLDLVDHCMGYIDDIPPYIDIIITTSNPLVKQRYHDLFVDRGIVTAQVRLIENHGRDTAALLIDCRDILMQYDYLCFTHDKKSSGISAPQVGRSFMYLLWENTLASYSYIENVLAEFEKNPRLGFLSVPRPYHEHLFTTFASGWGENFDGVKSLADRLGLNSKISDKQPLFALGTAFWCRPAAMKALFSHHFERRDFPVEPAPPDGTIMHAIERILPYVAQHEGYYSGIMSSDRYAGTRMIDVEYMLSNLIIRFGIYDSGMNYFQCLEYLVNSAGVDSFCSTHRPTYIYGAGGMGDYYANLLEKRKLQYSGFIVSDGMPKKETLRGRPVFYLSEITPEKDNCGIIIALNHKNKEQVIPALQKLGFRNIMSIS